MKQTKEIAAYVRNNVEDYEVRLGLALGRMGCTRCPLSMADRTLFDEIVDAISDWCEDNEVSVDFFDDWDEIIEGENGIIWED